MGYQVQIDALVGPVAEGGEIGDGRAGGDGQVAVEPEAPDHVRSAGIRGDDDVRPEAADRPQQAPPADQVHQRARQPAGRREVHDQPVLEVVEEGEPTEDDLGPVADDPGDQRAHRVEAVDDLHLRVGPLLEDPRREHARRGVVPLADVGGDNQYPGRPRHDGAW